MIRTHRTPASPRFTSVETLEQTVRRRSWLAAGLGLALGLALPPLLGRAADSPPVSGVDPAGASSGKRVLQWSPAPPRIALADMIRENPAELRRLDLEAMTRR